MSVLVTAALHCGKLMLNLSYSNLSKGKMIKLLLLITGNCVTTQGALANDNLAVQVVSLRFQISFVNLESAFGHS